MVKIGDKVKFLNDIGGGTVVSFSGKNMVNVENEEGFEIPTLISELVVEGDNDEVSSTKAPTAQSNEFENEQTSFNNIEQLSSLSPEFYFVFVPENKKNPTEGGMSTYLVNSGNANLLFNFSHIEKNRFISQKSGQIMANSKMLLESFSHRELNDLSEFYFQLVFFEANSEKVEMPIYKRIKINPVKFYKEKSFTSNSFFSTPSYLIKLDSSDFEDELDQLTNKELRKVLKENQDIKVIQKKVSKTSELIEVDLHINELLDDVRGLSNHEMLNIQMDKFREELENAIKSKVKKIVFIHGIGNGTLKQTLRKELSNKFKKYSFQDASFQEYGFGATMVILRK